LKKFNYQFEQLIFADAYGITRLLPHHFTEKIPINTTISLFPLSGKVSGITTKGLKYPLQNEALENGVRDGTSNEVISTPVSIAYDVGDLLLFTAR
jgi:thiamine pyrophosphokinase